MCIRDRYGSRAFENLLDVLQDIANYAGIDFSVVSTDPASFQFRTHIDQLGTDRTTEGMDAVTGTNASGNTPVIFDINLGNVSSASRIERHSEEANAVVVLGEGDASTRYAITRTNPTGIATSPWNQREVSRPVSTPDDPSLPEDVLAELKTYAMETFGDEILAEMKAVEDIDFVPLQQPGTLYGMDFDIGDRITVRYQDWEVHKRIVAIKVNVGGQGEEITVEFAEVPGR